MPPARALLPGARTLELEGVTAALVPATPERSFVNAVIFERAELLAAAIDTLASTYAEAGVDAWCVWVPPAEGDAAAILEATGLVLDSTPQGMARGLRGVERPPSDALEEWTRDGDPRVMAELNDRSFGFDTDSFARAFSGLRPGETHVYIAWLGGLPVASLLASDHEGNCEIDGVATVPEARRRGISGALLGHALADASERGVSTTTLVATAAGRPVYERLGYRPLGVLELWEMRRSV